MCADFFARLYRRCPPSVLYASALPHCSSADGMESNVIKLKPPMVFSADNAEQVRPCLPFTDMGGLDQTPQVVAFTMIPAGALCRCLSCMQVICELDAVMSDLAATLTASGIIVGQTSGDDAAVPLARLAAQFYTAHPELQPRPFEISGAGGRPPSSA